jgi:hypothetical protein
MLFFVPAIAVILVGGIAIVQIAAVDPVAAQWLALGILTATAVAGSVVVWFMLKKLRR